MRFTMLLGAFLLSMACPQDNAGGQLKPMDCSAGCKVCESGYSCSGGNVEACASGALCTVLENQRVDDCQAGSTCVSNQGIIQSCSGTCTAELGTHLVLCKAGSACVAKSGAPLQCETGASCRSGQ